MGNTASSVTSGVKAQANAAIEMYSLVDVNGGGELVELMKKATKTKDYNELDETILSKIGKYVSNGGKGICHPIHKFVLRRNKERPPTKQITPPKELPKDETVAGKYIPGAHDPSMVTDHRTYRLQCWDFPHLGAVGETVLHLCVLNATSVHSDVAKRVLRHFPHVINDIYLCDEYYGENVLHIAIVNEDPSMVKFLLDNGANYHERCYGNFMCPEDQKASRSDSLDHEWVDVTVNTNYAGYIYWGEYPLSFAACLSQEECYRLILAKGANPDNQDSNGNTVVHMMVIHDKMDMFDMAFELGASLAVQNRQGLIPLTLASILARRDLFFHILNIEREIYWQIGNVTCAAYPLDYLDTINTKTGETQKKSALNLITYGEKEAHLDLMEGPIVDLLKTKWETFVKFRFYRLFFIFLIYFLISLGTYVLRPVPCSAPKTHQKTSRPLSIMTLPALDISCVNVSVALSPDVVVLQPTIPKDENQTQLALFHQGKKIINITMATPLPIVTSQQTSHNVTADPNVEDEIPYPEDDYLTLEDGNTSSNVLEDITVTMTPDELVTAQYYIEGEQVSVTLATTLHDLLTSTSDPVSGEVRKPSLSSNSPLLLTCFNKTHDLTLTGQNRTFYIAEIVKRHKFSREHTIAPAVNPWDHDNDTLNDTDDNPCSCYLWRKPKPLPVGEVYILGVSWSVGSFYVRIICEGFTLMGSLAYLMGATREARFQGLKMFFKNLSTVPARVLFLFACALVVVMAVLRFCCMSEAEDVVAVLAMLCTGPYFLFFCRGFKTVGPMVTMIYTMIRGDLLRFVTIYTVFVMGFSQAYYVLFSSYRVMSAKAQCSGNPLSTPVESVMTMFIMSLGNFGDLYGDIECTDHEITGKVMFLIFMAIVALLLINLLIAMMGNTYCLIAEMKNEWMRQWARIVLVVERGLSPEVRLQKLMEYSQPMSDGRRALVLRLHQNDDEREEMKDILEMKRVHRRYVERRKAKLKKMQERNEKASRASKMENC